MRRSTAEALADAATDHMGIDPFEYGTAADFMAGLAAPENRGLLMAWLRANRVMPEAPEWVREGHRHRLADWMAGVADREADNGTTMDDRWYMVINILRGEPS